MNALTPAELPAMVRDYVAGIPEETRPRLLRAAVLRWFDGPLLERVLSDLGDPVDFAEFIRLPAIARTSRDTYSVISPMKEELAGIFREESPQEYARATLIAADYFHRPLDEVPETEASGVVEEIAYLSQADPDGCAERLADFGVRAVLSGWVEAAGRASMVVEPAIGRAGGSAHLTTTARLLESIVTASRQDGRPKRSEQRSLNSLAKKAERADYATELLRLLAAVARGLAGAKRRRVAAAAPWWRPYLAAAQYAGRLVTPFLPVPELAALAEIATPARPGLAERLAAVVDDTAESEPRLSIGSVRDVRISLQQPSYPVPEPPRFRSALFVAIISALLVVSGAGTAALLGSATTLSSAWVIAGIFSPTALFLIIQLGVYLVRPFRPGGQDIPVLAVPAPPAAAVAIEDDTGDSVPRQAENPWA